jgi:nuclear GTP-binding protein
MMLSVSAPLFGGLLGRQIIGGSLMMKNQAGGQKITSSTGRIAPDRRWFGNTRVIAQNDLDR